MTKFRKIKPKSSRRKKLILFFVAFSILFISCGYSILGSDVGLSGTLFVDQYKNKAVIQKLSGNTKFRSSTYRTKIETITLSESINPPESYIESWNLGINDKSNVMGYITKRSDANIYDLYIQGDGNLYANPDSSYLFSGFEGLQEIIGLDKLNTSEVTDMSYMFAVSTSYFSGKSKLTSLDLSTFDTSKVTNMSHMFNYCTGLVSLDLSGFDTSNVTTMQSMFYNCSSLTSLDLSGFDTSKVTNMYDMFCNCIGLTSLNVSRFDTSSVTNMESMFHQCQVLTSLDVSGFDTSHVTNMEGMFQNCSSLAILDVSKFNTSNVTTMNSMFFNCSSLTSLDLSGFDTSNVTDISSMFGSCSGLTSLDVTNFDTSNVSNMSSMFSFCSGLTSLDLSRFNISKVTNISSMFYNCMNLVTIYVESKWTYSIVIRSTDMFYGCTKLVGAVAFDSTKTGVSMANYTTGYFTLKSFAGDLKKLAASSTVIVDDGTTDHNMRFTGKSPNNYVTFNGEEWRVVGVFNNISNGSGTSESRVKIIRNSSIGLKPWDSNNSNTWSKASLNKELQTLYGSNEMVDNAVWYLGDSGSTVPITKESYVIERGTKVASGNGQTWTGKVGLMYPSDYGFASSACKDGSKTLRYYNDSTCVNTNWMYIGTYEWTISPQAHNTDRVRGVDVDDYGSGYISGYLANSTFYETRPTLYLKSTVRCKNCSDSSAGTKANPFILAY